MGGVHGKEAQEEKARKKAEKRQLKVEAAQHRKEAATSQHEARVRMGKALQQLFGTFTRGLGDAVEEEVVTRTRAMKQQNELLRSQLQEAKKLAESRKAELDVQVRRAREAESALNHASESVAELRGKLEASEVSEKALKSALAKAQTKKAVKTDTKQNGG